MLNYRELRQEFSRKTEYFPVWPLLVFITALVLLIGLFDGMAHANEIKFEDAVHAVAAEGESQGLDGMQAISCTIRNRNSLKGVCALKNVMVKNRHLYKKVSLKSKYYKRTRNKYRQIPDDIVRMASIAWVSSADQENCAYINGATNWENINDFGKPAWAYKMQEVYRLKDHVFYAEVKR